LFFKEEEATNSINTNFERKFTDIWCSLNFSFKYDFPKVFHFLFSIICFLEHSADCSLSIHSRRNRNQV
jgi:hypothetical protein